jgi:thymidylate synthase
MEFKFRNVQDAFNSLVKKIEDHDIELDVEQSRNGQVFVFPGVTTITYTHPKERVLFNLARDANPFFHLYESFWMLAGQNDVASLNYYNSNMKNYSDNDKTFNGAYGFRWRVALLHPELETYDDQIELLINHLKDNPNSRRAVLQMWNTYDDLTKIDTSKDVCCNLNVVFKIVNDKLNMVVFNRSNDLIWGALGANAVHFSILQEYIACCLDCEVGTYSQVSANMHIYSDVWKGQEYTKESNLFGWPEDVYIGTPQKLVHDKKQFDLDFKNLLENNDYHSNEPFLYGTLSPMLLAWRHHKERNYVKAQEALNRVQSADWKVAGTLWIEKRQQNYEKKHILVT